MVLAEDIKFGKKNERQLLKIIQDKFGKDLQPAENRFAPFDFVSDKVCVELKSRTCKHDTYPDTMIGKNKVNYATKATNKEFYFVFNFTDGLYYFKHDNNYNYDTRVSLFSKKECTPQKVHCFIPIDNLIKV